MANRPLVIGWGNPGRGDDALGPLLVERLDALEQRLHDGISCHQLQPEQIFDLDGRPLVLLADASVSVPAPFGFERLKAERTIACSSHQLAPEALLYLHELLLQRPPPPCFMLSIRGVRFAPGESVSAAALDNLESAFLFSCRLLRSEAAISSGQIGQEQDFARMLQPDP